MRNWVAPWCRDGRPEGAAMRVLRHTDKFHERLETLYQHFLSPTSLVNDWTQATPCPETERNYMVSFYNSQPALSLHFGLQPCCFFTQLFDPDPTGSCQARRVPKSPLLMLKAWTAPNLKQTVFRPSGSSFHDGAALTSRKSAQELVLR
ncbi:unnamed protein product [Durusdinium trenchii]|uniref:Uncharacterized protein n=1 Tax=Durusdinium trenchii TaxID=1381693 RepID=A0ABP0HIK7_9DINO